MPPPFERHLFVCTNRRPDGNPKGCCASKGSEALQRKLKEEVGRRGLHGKVRVNSAGCLDACASGTSIVVYPEGVWYGPVTLADVDELVEQHLVQGHPVARLKAKLP
jgi:(2Fe-2S) ferredoxin